MSDPTKGEVQAPSALRVWGAVAVTLAAALLVSSIRLGSVDFRKQYPALSLPDPARALFLLAEHQRRVVQSRAVPRALSTTADCFACSRDGLDKTFERLFREAEEVRRRYRKPKIDGEWMRDAEAVRRVALAGWNDQVALAELRHGGPMPAYVAVRVAELRRGSSAEEDERVRRAGRWAFSLVCLWWGLLLLAIGTFTLFTWRSAILGLPRRHVALSAPTLGRSIVVLVWSQGVAAASTWLRWEHVPVVARLVELFPSLPLALATVALIVATRPATLQRPLGGLTRCPSQSRKLAALVLAGVAATGLVLAATWGTHRLAALLGDSPAWANRVVPKELYGTPFELGCHALSSIILAPLGEELFYRGVLFGILTRRLSVHWAALVSAVVFAYMHGYGWVGFVDVAFSGYIAARLRARTGSLVPCFVSHAGVNLVALLYSLAARG